MTEKKTTPRKKKVTTKKPVKKVEEKIELETVSIDTREPMSQEDMPTEAYVNEEPIITISEVLPKEYEINYKKITTVKDIVLLLKGLGLKTLKIHESDIDDIVRGLITRKYIKEV